MPPLLCVPEPGAAPDGACFTGRAALAVSGVTVPELLAILADLAFRKTVEMECLSVGRPALESGDPFGDRDCPFVSRGQEENGLVLPSVSVKRTRAAGRIVGYLHVFRSGRDLSPEDAEVTEFPGSLLAAEPRKNPDPRDKDEKKREIGHFFADILENDHDGAEVARR